MIKSAAKLREEAIKKVIGLKRTALDDLLESHRPRKIAQQICDQSLARLALPQTFLFDDE
jgi:hypothetical protein